MTCKLAWVKPIFRHLYLEPNGNWQYYFVVKKVDDKVEIHNSFYNHTIIAKEEHLNIEK
jgi:hypothetical protein